MAGRSLTKEELERYSRQIMLKEVGEEGQQKLLNSSVLVIGAGGLGSPVLLYLAAAGIGTIGIADGDVVNISNLQRQIIHFSDDVNKKKVLSAEDKIRQLNPNTVVKCYPEYLDSSNIRDIISTYDFVIDATDNFKAKFLINDVCIELGIPFSHGGILETKGQTMTVIPDKSPCYRCIFPHPPSDNIAKACSFGGVMGVLPGVIGTIQATEAIKFILNIGKLLTGRLLTYDLMDMRFREITFGKNPQCPVCARSPKS
ncbi:MAG: HesA/MoeB/ThiF family protein [Desulfuromonadales bacterium]|nr:HesA/MoeB/ThiF family protein [Desulfuromonadales bacterium]